MQLKAVLGDVADRLKWEPLQHPPELGRRRPRIIGLH
jgi:hypothetical protein